jgi:hypothetical protein
MIEPPQRIPVGGDGAMSRDAAEALKASNVAALSAQGYKLLSSRSTGSWMTGGGISKPILDPKGDMYMSVRAAARDLGKPPGSIVRWLKNSKSGWKYI